ncbi:hypothetical protein [Ensifer sp. LBL]|uniref:hypothetical protein n=1 Tax=Ensifer sp. LBL TaxID=2991056 RepID=UPI003D206E33
MARSTVGLVLRRLGLNRLALLQPKLPVVPCERHGPGEMIHLDIKELGKINGIGHRFLRRRPGMHTNKGHGWDFLHVAIDDASRLAYTEILPSEGQADSTDFLNRALSWFSRLDVKTEQMMTDNGSAYRSAACHSLTAGRWPTYSNPTLYSSHKWQGRTLRPVRPRAYANPYHSRLHRSQAAADWTTHYNLMRPHAGIAGTSPFQGLNNLLGNET